MQRESNHQRKYYSATEMVQGREKGKTKNKTFRIKTSHGNWIITGVKTISIVDKREIIFFGIQGYSGFTFTLENGKLTGKKKEVTRASDSGFLSNTDNRFNLVTDNGTRKTLRLTTLMEILPKIFNGELSNE